MNIQNIADLTGPQQQKSDFNHLTDSLGDAFVASTPVPTNPVPGDDDPRVIERASAPSPEAVARAEALLGRARKATGEDRFPAAIACALLGRSNGHSELDAWGLLKNLNQNICEPPLVPSRLRDTIYAAYVELVVAEQIITDALSAATNDAPMGDGIRPPGALVRAEANLPANRETLPVDPKTATVEPSATAGAGAADNAPVESPTGIGPPPIVRAMSAKERMARRRAELKRLGLPAKTKGSLKDLRVTPAAESVTSPVTPVVGVTLPVTPVVTQPSDATEVANAQ